MADPIKRIQLYLPNRYTNHEIVPISPFTLHFPKSETPVSDSYALPTEPITGDITEAVAEVTAVFRERGVTPRIQYLDAFCPTLTAVIEQAGYQQEKSSMMLMCTPETYRPAPTMPGLNTLILSENSSLDDLVSGIETHVLGFDPEERVLRDTDAEMFRQTLITSRAFILRMEDEPVTTGMFTAVHNGVTEIMGISTLPAYRRRGFAAYLTSYMAQIAFARQVDLVFLITPDDETTAVYQRVGFQPRALQLTYYLPDGE